MTNPKMKPCPKCKTADYLGCYKYDSGTRRVECDNDQCWYIGPPEGSVRQAIKSHNEKAMTPPVHSAAPPNSTGSQS